MTAPGRPDYRLDMDEVEQLGRVIAPQIREGFRADLDTQTKAIKVFVDDHEQRDDQQFNEIKVSLLRGSERMNTTERKMAWVGGAIACLTVLVPIIIELIKWKTK